MGWWKPDPQAAQELLEKAGYNKRNGAWMTPDGKPFTIRVMVEGDLRPVMTRAGTMIVQQWKQAGIDAKIDVAQGTLADAPRRRRFRHLHRLERRDLGRPPGPVLLPGQLAFAVRRRARQAAAGAQLAALGEPRLDKIIEQTRTVGFDDPKSIELGKDYVKLAVQEMPTIPLMAYNVFTAMDQTYWTGYPTAENPYTDPVPNWGNSRYMFVKLKPAN